MWSEPHQETNMKRTTMSALFCGAILTASSAFAAGIGVGGTAGGGIGAGPVTGAAGTSVGTGVNTTGQVTTQAGGVNNYSAADINAALGVPDTTVGTTTAMNRNGASRSTGGLSTSGEINNATAGNNAGSVDTTIQTPSSRMRQQAQANANAATEEQTTRQLNQQQANPAISGTVNGAIQ
jgi:hypothetical protein